MRLPTALWIFVICCAALAACGHSASAPKPSPSHTSAAAVSASPASTVSAKQQFINSVRTAGLGSKDIASETDRQLLALGRRECKIMTDSFANGANGYRSLIHATMTGVPDATEGQAAIWVDSAIRDLCPAWSSQLPAGAP